MTCGIAAGSSGFSGGRLSAYAPKTDDAVASMSRGYPTEPPVSGHPDPPWADILIHPSVCGYALAPTSFFSLRSLSAFSAVRRFVGRVR